VKDYVLLRALFVDAKVLETLGRTYKMAQMLGCSSAIAQGSELSDDTYTLRQDTTSARVFYEAAHIQYQIISSTDMGVDGVSRCQMTVSDY
jgi:hypothetical protein